MSPASSRFLLTALPVLCALAPAGTHARQQREPPPPTDRVTIDFVVVGSDGRPVRDLKADEVAVRIDGRIRRIQSLQIVAVAAATAGPPVQAVAPPYGTNTPAGRDAGRTLALVIDDDSFRPGGSGRCGKRSTAWSPRSRPPTRLRSSRCRTAA